MARKHYSQMTRLELSYLSKIAAWVAGKSLGAARHCLERMRERNICWEDVVDAIGNGEVVELNVENGTPRLLVRGRRVVGRDNICVVVAPKTRFVLTAYRNRADDVHSTIRLEQYDAQLSVISALNA